MEKNSTIAQGSKSEKYKSLIPQIHTLVSAETDEVAKMANITAALKQAFDFFWVGFYVVKGEELVLGPFQGPVACMRIKFGKGVCGTAWKTRQTQIVPDVERFEGHIACNSASKSEIVVPIIKEGEIVAVLDIDSDQLNTFDAIDAIYLEKLLRKVM
ncbi:GAF domain-containing protein [Parabacteroides sp. OttesenSCG-928-G07]|nr:GAF domain-containing protein [Parabacteroides sp. OttesenSCG-928-G07]